MKIQNFAYCRYIYIWSILFLLNIVTFSPLSSLLVIFIFESYSFLMHKKIYMLDSKSNGIIFFDFFFLFLVLIKDSKPYILQNLIFFILYNIILQLNGLNVLNVHNNLLKQDDIIHKHENYFDYFKRIWSNVIN